MVLKKKGVAGINSQDLIHFIVFANGILLPRWLNGAILDYAISNVPHHLLSPCPLRLGRTGVHIAKVINMGDILRLVASQRG